MTDPRDRALLLDLDGVLRRWPADLARRAERAAGLPAGAIHAAAFEPQLLHRAVTGAIDDGTWRSEAALRLARGRTLLSALQAMAAWSASPGVVDEAVRALGIAGDVDAVVNSSAVGVAKPDPRLLQVALAAGGASASRSLFVDDTAAHVAAAEALGLAGHVFVDAAGLARALAEHRLIGGPGP